MRALLVIILTLAACASPAMTAAPRTAEPAGFRLALVQSHFRDLCTNPTFDLDDPCRRMKIDGMTADGLILNVPTVLNSAGWAPADDICHVIKANQYGSTGETLGYGPINILDKFGGTLATCKASAATAP